VNAISPRVVFDTNILFFAAGWPGNPHRCIQAARSDLVSGDRHLLTLGKYQDIEIVRAAEFLALLRPHPSPESTVREKTGDRT
jgi:predicted nucleic acid-binding protein